MLDAEQRKGSAGSLRHQPDTAGHLGFLGSGDALLGLQRDPEQRRVEAEPRGLPQYLGSELSLWNHVGSHLLGLWATHRLHSFSLLHPQLISRLLPDASVLPAGLDEETGRWFRPGQQQHRLNETTHAANSGEELEGFYHFTK